MLAPPDLLRFLPSLLVYLIKLCWTGIALTAALLIYTGNFGATDAILVQNPPGVPTLLVCWLVAKFKRACILYAHNIVVPVNDLVLCETASQKTENVSRRV